MLLDGRLYMPECWWDDPKRREKAQVPDTLTFATKPMQALEMLNHAVTDLKVPGRWVVGDEVYGSCGISIGGGTKGLSLGKVASPMERWTGMPCPRIRRATNQGIKKEWESADR